MHPVFFSPSAQAGGQHNAVTRALSPSGKHRLLHPISYLPWLTPAARRPFSLLLTFCLVYFLFIYFFIPSLLWCGSNGQIKRFLQESRSCAKKCKWISRAAGQTVFSEIPPSPMFFSSIPVMFDIKKKYAWCIVNAELIIYDKDAWAKKDEKVNRSKIFVRLSNRK